MRACPVMELTMSAFHPKRTLGSPRALHCPICKTHRAPDGKISHRNGFPKPLHCARCTAAFSKMHRAPDGKFSHRSGFPKPLQCARCTATLSKTHRAPDGSLGIAVPSPTPLQAALTAATPGLPRDLAESNYADFAFRHVICFLGAKKRLSLRVRAAYRPCFGRSQQSRASSKASHSIRHPPNAVAPDSHSSDAHAPSDPGHGPRPRGRASLQVQ